ncbi:hypothetical protein L9F63_027695, partial [Diploptera punctata]
VYNRYKQLLLQRIDPSVDPSEIQDDLIGLGKWEESPVILTVDSRVAEIDEIPFPAVTVCPPSVLTKQHASQLLNETLFEAQDDASYYARLNFLEKALC